MRATRRSGSSAKPRRNRLAFSRFRRASRVVHEHSLPWIGRISPPWTSIHDAGVDQRTPNLAPIVQEIVDAPGWAALGAMSFIIGPNPGGERTAVSFNGDPTLAPRLHVSYSTFPTFRAGDADEDFDFDQFDLIRVQQSAKYLTGLAATWGEGDWDGSQGGPGNPPEGDGVFDQFDVIAAQQEGIYLTGTYAALAEGGEHGDDQTSIIYDASTGEIAVDAPAGFELTSINIDSAAGIFTGAEAQNLGGSFDHSAENNIFKATFGASFGSLSFGNVAQIGLPFQMIADDLTVIGSLAGGGGLGEVDLIYVAVPEPAAWTMLLTTVLVWLFTHVWTIRGRRILRRDRRCACPI